MKIFWKKNSNCDIYKFIVYFFILMKFLFLIYLSENIQGCMYWLLYTLFTFGRMILGRIVLRCRLNHLSILIRYALLLLPNHQILEAKGRFSDFEDIRLPGLGLVYGFLMQYLNCKIWNCHYFDSHINLCILRIVQI